MTDYRKLNDYTLEEETLLEAPGSSGYGWSITQQMTLKRIFNFAAQQVTTILLTQAQSIVQSGNDSCSTTTEMKIENFKDIQGKTEIEAMHERLVELEGHPPSLPDAYRARPVTGTILNG